MPLPDVPAAGAPALTTVRFALTRATGTPGATTARLLAGKWTFTPVPGTRSTTTRLAPATFQVRPTAEEIAAGSFALDLYATDDPAWLAAWCWKVREPFPGTTRYVAVPRAGGPLEYAALTEVDPTTLAAAPSPATVDAEQRLAIDTAARVADLEAAVLSLQGATTVVGTPAYEHTPIGDTPAAVAAYVEDYLPAAAGYITGTLGGTI